MSDGRWFYVKQHFQPVPHVRRDTLALDNESQYNVETRGPTGEGYLQRNSQDWFDSGSPDVSGDSVGAAQELLIPPGSLPTSAFLDE